MRATTPTPRPPRTKKEKEKERLETVDAPLETERSGDFSFAARATTRQIRVASEAILDATRRLRVASATARAPQGASRRERRTFTSVRKTSSDASRPGVTRRDRQNEPRVVRFETHSAVG
jgi:hypothetical protein